VQVMIAQDVANILAEEAFDTLAKLLRAIDVGLLHPPRTVGGIRLARRKFRDLLLHAVIPTDVGDQILHMREGLHGLDSDGLAEVLIGWIDRYPIVSIEDPMAEDDAEGMTRFTAAVGERVQIIGDDFLVTNAALVEQAAAQGACNAVLIKPNQAGTMTETKAALDAGRRAGFGTIVSARSGETEDVTIAHLAVGWNAGQLKVGSFARSERMAKWNEMLRIEEALGHTARFAGRDALPMRPHGPGTSPPA